MTLRRRHLMPALASVASGFAAPARADGSALAIGVAVETTSIDPQFFNTTGNYTVTRHIFEPLLFQDRQQRLIPGLATGWEAVSDRDWIFRLRPGVRFHDGRLFGADDVVFSLRRAPTVPNSPGNFAIYTRQIEAVTAVDPLTVRIRTRAADPLLPVELSTILIVSAATAGASDTAAFNTGAAAIGTGPYRFVSWTKADRVRLVRNDAYWGPVAAWREVALRVIPDGGARVSALLSGDVDVIDAVPAALISSLRGRGDVTVVEAVSSRLIYVSLDSARAISPFVTGADRAPLDPNPFRDPRVRHAVSRAIDRTALADQVLEGHAVAAGQMLPDGFPATSPDLRPEAHDPDGARALLAAAGFPTGFGLTLHGPQNRYGGDVELGQAIAQMLSRVGIRARFEPEISSVALGRLQRRETSAYLWGWASETGEPSGALRALVAANDATRGWGVANRLHDVIPGFDDALAQALVMMDDTARDRAIEAATGIAMRDASFLPLVFLKSGWAIRRGLAFEANAMGYSFAFDTRPV